MFTVVIPPPNITGSLHMGHALNNTIQDITIRFKRMQGCKVLWQPGTDHAGIATQNKVEQALAAEGLTRHDLGREKFIARCWAWREQYGREIVEQLRILGCSCDWERERFTMDEGLSRAVRTAFKAYYDAGMIYRGARMVNWCTRCHTSISDLEVEYEDQSSHLWYVRYPLADGSGDLVVATTRPETMLGDTAVAVHPEDERYRAFIGREVDLPLTGRRIPVIADERVDPAFGTGAVKVTPAHDPNDHEMAGRHGLKSLVVIDFEGRMTAEAGAGYAGLGIEECRKKVVADLDKLGLVEKIEDYSHSVGTCYRCHETIEPLVSEQWWMDMSPLKDAAIRVVERGEVKFIPERWTKVYLDWMENLRDWNIGRQLWWGHRMPLWRCDACGEIVVETQTPERCPKCGGALRQEEDVLDTWFSSALWPLSTLGWPDDEEQLAKLYPTAVLSTAPDIIYLWVARMIMSGMHFRGEKPFSHVYLHATILAQDGRRMSKSLGTGVDPREVTAEYGTDALRFTLVILTGQGQSVRLWEDRFTVGRNFANKVWNAARFLALNLTGSRLAEAAPLTAAELPDDRYLTLEDRWIISRLGRIAGEVTDALEAYRFNEAAHLAYEAFWHDYCDWYLELIKPRLYGDDPKAKGVALAVALHGMRLLLKLLHPIMPFITEELFHRLFPNAPADLMVSPWEDHEDWPGYAGDEAHVERLQKLIDTVRNIRGEMGVPPGAKVRLLVKTTDGDLAALVKAQAGFFANLAGVEEIETGPEVVKPKGAAVGVAGDVELYVPLAGVVDFSAELERLFRDLDKVCERLGKVEKKLDDAQFRSKAPVEVVKGEEEKRDRMAAEIKAMDNHSVQVEDLLYLSFREGGVMSFNFRNLDDLTRQKMLEEVELDIERGCLYISPRLIAGVEEKYKNLLVDAVKYNDEEWLAEQIEKMGLLKTREMYTRSGITRERAVPINAHLVLAEGEFNRFYVRAICKRVLEQGLNVVIVYRGKIVSNPRPDSESKIGSTIDAKSLLGDLRDHPGVDTALGLPPGPNSGLTVALPA
ncbi:MAG: valine--tRNA ligase [Candidatus Coatesbacteria bacterium RBG_13_66_14]|uniref:Valine--tRNA ligase n=1 Tax=Candidatus Coatesbacteria bacterium RBG_13_66_14 TaxID=1817816 RepID=A0A1F5FHW0_9BACT|nr:MAG: valine--tRNA ligase [Candidatus Coatesbacteria bacterium RBG_13_66_14]